MPGEKVANLTQEVKEGKWLLFDDKSFTRTYPTCKWHCQSGPSCSCSTQWMEVTGARGRGRGGEQELVRQQGGGESDRNEQYSGNLGSPQHCPVQ